MAFNPNVPQPPQFVSASQPVFLANNQTLDNVFGKNHFKFSDGTGNAGRHTFVEMVERTVIPSGLINGEGTLYTKNTSGTQLYFTDGSTGKEYQMTRTTNASFATFAASNPGWSFLPGGLLIQWGDKVTPGGSGSVTFARSFTNPPFSVTLLPRAAAGGHSAFTYYLVGAPTAAGFSYAGTTTFSTDLYYIAIGI